MSIRGVCPIMACERIDAERAKRKTKIEACRIVAEELGLSVETVRTWEKRRGSDEPSDNQDVVTATKKYETCTVSELQSLIDSDKTFSTIYADPPWPYSNQATRSATDNHYQTMSIDDICNLPIPSLLTENAHLHLWTTNAFIFEAPKIFEAWGFEYKSCFVWVKKQIGIGNYWRLAHEFLLFGLRGKAPFRDRSQRSWQQMERGSHSTKPEAVPRIIEKVSGGPYLELFARRKRKGWTCWGNEISTGEFYEQLRVMSSD